MGRLNGVASKELAIDRLSFLYINLYQSRLGICFHLRLLGFFRGSHPHLETNALIASMGLLQNRQRHYLSQNLKSHHCVCVELQDLGSVTENKFLGCIETLVTDMRRDTYLHAYKDYKRHKETY